MRRHSVGSTRQGSPHTGIGPGRAPCTSSSCRTAWPHTPGCLRACASQHEGGEHGLLPDGTATVNALRRYVRVYVCVCLHVCMCVSLVWGRDRYACSVSCRCHQVLVSSSDPKYLRTPAIMHTHTHTHTCTHTHAPSHTSLPAHCPSCPHVYFPSPDVLRNPLLHWVLQTDPNAESRHSEAEYVALTLRLAIVEPHATAVCRTTHTHTHNPVRAREKKKREHKLNVTQ